MVGDVLFAFGDAILYVFREHDFSDVFIVTNEDEYLNAIAGDNVGALCNICVLFSILIEHW